MSIANKLTYLNDTREKIREGLNKLGGGILPSDTFRSYADAIEEIYDSMPKVEESDVESATLDGTIKGGLTINPKGNTSQYSTTGKNLANCQGLTTQTINGVTFTPKYDDKGLLEYVNVNGTASALTNYTFTNEATYSAGNYDLQKISSPSDDKVVIMLVNRNGAVLENRSTDGKSSFTISESQIAKLWLRVFSGQTINNVKIYPQLKLSSITDDTYEPYTGGASPNPDYPQPINVVTGDNEVVVCAKNIYDISNQLAGNGITINGNDITITDSSGWGQAYYISSKKFYAGQYSIKFFKNNGTLRVVIRGYKNGSVYTDAITATGLITPTYSSYYGATVYTSIDSSATFTLDNTCDYYCIGFSLGRNGTETINVEMDKGNIIPSTFTSYTSQTYPINLGVENLFEPTLKVENDNISTSRCSVSLVGDEYTFSATGSDCYFGNIIASGNSYQNGFGTLYDVSGLTNLVFKPTNSQFDKNYVCYFNSSKISLGFSQVDNDTGLITLPENTKYICFRIGVSNSVSGTDYKTKIQLEKGSKMNSYTPYGTTPIELCKIGDYQDYFTKNSGKNLWNKETVSNGYIKEDGTLGSTQSDSYVTSDFIPVKPNETYYQPDRGTPRAKYYDINKQLINTTSYQDISIGGSEGSFTIPSGVYYVRMSIFQTYITNDKMMLNEGSTPLPYEPYGTGQWCKYNAIGKVVFNGTENWTKYTDYVFYTTKLSEVRNSYSNYYKFVATQTAGALNNGEYCWASAGNGYTPLFKNTDYNDATNFKTWLSTHNTIVYYVLATPYLSLIEDETLISQLDNIQNAMSYEGQTNVLQVNNDKPFKIDAKAILDWRN